MDASWTFNVELTYCGCVSAQWVHLSLHDLRDTFKAAVRKIYFFFKMNSHQLNCAVNPVLFCERAGPLIGTTHESLKRATSLCSETAINDKQETLKMSHGEDEKTTFLCCSRKQTFLVVPHIKLPLTQILTHIQTRSDESWLARGCFLYLSPVIFVCL